MGIEFTASYPYIPKPNGTAERMNRIFLEKTKGMTKEESGKPDFWAESIQTAACLHNCTVHSAWRAINLRKAVYGTPPKNSKNASLGIRSFPVPTQENWSAKIGKQLREGIQSRDEGGYASDLY